MELLNCMLKKLNYWLQLLELLKMFLNFECFIRMIFQSSAHCGILCANGSDYEIAIFCNVLPCCLVDT